MRKGHTAYCKFLKMKKDYTEKDPNASAGSTENVAPKKSGSKVVATVKKRKSTEQEARDDDDEVAKKVKPEPKEEPADIFDEFN
ncbi:hypothetical protein Tdes44962_MAKER02948 [Teratosphaeria destructans]|uniref:Uncharacterized protein n=1 Tax=Teratosphaeria destructans TaxID=418781 RepID=A0A9W7SRQ2_9PEZI|nr:hypothetical protein Tdes44962_MAKER02948 [Teratosphaeria destructans]